MPTGQPLWQGLLGAVQAALGFINGHIPGISQRHFIKVMAADQGVPGWASGTSWGPYFLQAYYLTSF